MEFDINEIVIQLVQGNACIHEKYSDSFVDNLRKKNACKKITEEFENITGYSMEGAYFVNTFINEINMEKIFL